MIRSLLIAWLGLALLAAPATAQDGDADGTSDEAPASEGDTTEPDADPISKYRVRFDELAERTIGTASKPVAFNWRRSSFQVAANGSFLFELNNFNSMRGGAMLRLPSGGAIIEIGASYVRTWDTPSSRQLALTPYRQPGRPHRLEVDFGLAYPLAEGVVTAAPRIFPTTQLVFNAYAHVRYMVYPNGWGGMRPRQVIGAIFSPSMTEQELENLDDFRLDAMEIDSGRYGVMLGLGNDLYFEQGFFVSPRMMLAVPLLAPASGTNLLFWADFTLSVGMSF